MSIVYYIKAILSLLFILGVLYAVLWWVKKFQKIKYASEMKIIDKLALSPGVSLMVVQIKGDSYVAGVSGKELSLLRKIQS